MGQRRNAESVRNFVIFLLILQNCGLARTQPEIVKQQQELPQQQQQQRRDGLAKLEFSGSVVATSDPLHVFNFANIYETLYAQLQRAATGPQRESGRGLVWEKSKPKPFHVLQQLQLDLEEQLRHRTTVKPFSVLQHLALEQAAQLQQSNPNASFNILQALQKEQEQLNKHTSTVKPFHVVEQLTQELQEQENAFEELPEQSAAAAVQQDEPLEQHKAVPAEATRAKDSQKRKRKRIRRRRKRIRRRRKRKRRRGKKKRKKKRKKRKKKKDKDDKKKKKRKKRKKPTTAAHPIGQQAQLIYANPTKQPYYPHHYNYPQQQQQQPAILQVLTTKPPANTPASPFSKIKYLLRHNNLFKKKKKEWFSHVGYVLYPFIKFVAFFTVLNPFTLGVFLFTLISPAVFGFIGFVALSVLVKPFLHLIFGVKRNVDVIERRRYLAHKRAEQLKLNLRPVTIHKHFYQQKPLHSTPPQHHPPLVDWRRHTAHPTQQAMQHPMQKPMHNPLLPPVRAALARQGPVLF